MTEPNDAEQLDAELENEDESIDDDADDELEASSDDEADEEGAEASGDDEEADGDKRPRKRRRRRRNNEVYVGDERAQDALQFLSSLIDKMGMDCRVKLLRPKAGAESDIQLEVSGRDAGRVIGKKGQVLSAVQFICNRVCNRPGQERRYITVDAEGYRNRRDNSLASMARRLGKQAVTDGKIITFEPMNPRDRRVVHLALAKFEGVVTKSEGEGDDRRVQIIPVRRV